MGRFGGVELDDLVLTSERLTLRPWRRDDAGAVHEAMQDRPMHEFLLLPDPYTPADATEFVTGFGDEGRAEGTGLGCALVETRTGRLVGSAAIRLPRRASTSADIGYWIAVGGRGRGYAAEASRTLAAWAFGQGVGRAEIRCAVGNLASARSALRAGFRFEAVLRDEGITADGPVDHAVFARLARDPGAPIKPVAPALPAAGLGDGVIGLRVLDVTDDQGVGEEETDPLTLRWNFGDATRGAHERRASLATAGLQWLVGPVLRCAMVDVATDSYAGMINIRMQGPPQVGGIGYGVHPAFRGRGYTARALRLLSSWAFGQADFVRLELGAKRDNLASQKAALAGGFEPDGVRTARLRNPDGTFGDEMRFALVNPHR